MMNDDEMIIHLTAVAKQHLEIYMRGLLGGMPASVCASVWNEMQEFAMTQKHQAQSRIAEVWAAKIKTP